jgi:hypothetical protein
MYQFTCKLYQFSSRHYSVSVQIKDWVLGYLFLGNIFAVNNSCKVEKIKPFLVLTLVLLSVLEKRNLLH